MIREAQRKNVLDPQQTVPILRDKKPLEEGMQDRKHRIAKSPGDPQHRSANTANSMGQGMLPNVEL